MKESGDNKKTVSVKRTRKAGAGVKSDDGVKSLSRKQVLLDPQTETMALQIGGGNLSLGLREAVRRAFERNDAEPFSVERHAGREALES